MKEDIPGLGAHDAKSKGRKAKAPKAKLSTPKRPKRRSWPPKMKLRDVEEIDTRKCLSMTMRIVRPPALPDVPHLPWGPFLN